MKNRTLVIEILFSLLLSSITANGQQAGKVLPDSRVDSASRIPNGDILDSIRYYIKTVPVDTSRDERMPKYTPGDAQFVPVDVQPVPVKKVRAKYPDEARQSKTEGTVWVKCLIGKDGNVQKANVVRSDAAIFNTAAISAAMQWKFTPARINGKPVAVWAALPFSFKLNE